MRLIRRRLGSREEWLGARRIGSSDVPRILTRDGRPLSPYGGPRAVQRRLLRQDQRPDDPDPDRVRGTRWEPVVITAAQVETGRRIRRVGPHTLYLGPTSWSTVSPDSFIESEPGSSEWGPGELKTDATGFPWGASRVVERWSVSLAGEIREDYAWQTMYQAWALDAPFAELIVLRPYYTVRVYRFLRDEEREAKMVRLLERFYERHVVDRIPCAPDDEDHREALLERTNPVDARGALVVRPPTPDEVLLVNAFELATKTRDYATEARLRAENDLLFRIGRSRGLALPDGRRVTVVRKDDQRPFILLSGGRTS